jgi:hypothetical protein
MAEGLPAAWREANLTAEQRLAVALFKTLLADLRTRDATRRQEAQAWFQSPDFAAWCELVGLAPEGVMSCVRSPRSSR